MQSNTIEELFNLKPQVLAAYNGLYKKISSSGCNYTNYEDIQNLYAISGSMSAYYGPASDFYEKCGLPFLKKHNPVTLDIIELSILFYTVQIFELVEKGFFSNVTLCLYNVNPEIFDYTEKMDFAKKAEENERPVFLSLWLYFSEFICIKDDREFQFIWDNSTDIYYITDEEYEEVLDMIFKSYESSYYHNIITQILGIYNIRFTKMKYILDYQSLFINVGCNYIFAVANEIEDKTTAISRS